MIGNDFETPIMYQDLANATMGPLAMPSCTVNPYANTNLLGGAAIKSQLDNDKLEIMKSKDNEDKNTFKKALGVLGLCLALGAVPIVRKNIKKAGGVGKYLKNKWNNFVNSLKGKKVRKPKKKSKNNGPSKTQRFKNWCSNKWSAFKNLFKRNNNPPPPSINVIIT